MIVEQVGENTVNEGGPSADTGTPETRADSPDAHGWQPIETAPRDGSSLLLYEDFEPAICAGYWGLESDEWRTSRGDGFWRPPTHWMPLPAPPVLP